MTQERLRELLHERVADETMPDFSGRAWQAARAVRRRRRLGAAAGVVVATIGVSAGIAAVRSTPPAPPTDRGISDLSEQPDTTPDATYQGVPVWWSPDQHEERACPDRLAAACRHRPGRPAVRRGRAPTARWRPSRAAGQWCSLGPDGDDAAQVDISRLQDVTKPNGYSYFPTSTGMLTSDGEWLVFPQPGETYAVYGIATGEWSTVDSYSDDADAALLDLGLRCVGGAAVRREPRRRPEPSAWGCRCRCATRGATSPARSSSVARRRGAGLHGAVGDGQQTASRTAARWRAGSTATRWSTSRGSAPAARRLAGRHPRLRPGLPYPRGVRRGQLRPLSALQEKSGSDPTESLDIGCDSRHCSVGTLPYRTGHRTRREPQP